MPSKLLGAGKSMGRLSFLSLTGLLRFLIKHWYITIFTIIILPQVISTFQVAIATHNPLHPGLELGKRIFTADLAIQDDVMVLQEQGVQGLIGYVKPTMGYWAQAKWYLSYFWNVIFRIFGNVWLMFMPLVLVYKALRLRNVSEVNKNIKLSVYFFIFYLFMVNILFVMFKVVTGEITILLPEGLTQNQQIWALFLHLIPFGGLISLVKYLIGVAV